jgi:hypothetical protein
VVVFKTRDFARFARKERIEDRALCECIRRADLGLIDAHLGSELIKQRVARRGQGRSGGYRTIIAFRASRRSVFLHGFAKNAKDTLSSEELAVLRRAAGIVLALETAAVAEAVRAGLWIEVKCHGETVQE